MQVEVSRNKVVLRMSPDNARVLYRLMCALTRRQVQEALDLVEPATFVQAGVPVYSRAPRKKLIETHRLVDFLREGLRASREGSPTPPAPKRRQRGE